MSAQDDVDEVDRLESVASEAVDAVIVLRASNAALRAENERLRGALRSLSDYDPAWYARRLDGGSWACCGCHGDVSSPGKETHAPDCPVPLVLEVMEGL